MTMHESLGSNFNNHICSSVLQLGLVIRGTTLQLSAHISRDCFVVDLGPLAPADQTIIHIYIFSFYQIGRFKKKKDNYLLEQNEAEHLYLQVIRWMIRTQLPETCIFREQNLS